MQDNCYEVVYRTGTYDCRRVNEPNAIMVDGGITVFSRWMYCGEFVLSGRCLEAGIGVMPPEGASDDELLVMEYLRRAHRVTTQSMSSIHT